MELKLQFNCDLIGQFGKNAEIGGEFTMYFAVHSVPHPEKYWNTTVPVEVRIDSFYNFLGHTVVQLRESRLGVQELV